MRIEGWYVIPNADSPDQDSLWDGMIHPSYGSAQASLDAARFDWGQDAENYHVVALVTATPHMVRKQKENN